MADKYGIQFQMVPIDNEALKASPVPSGGAVLPVFAVPSLPNVNIEVVSVGIVYMGVIPVDGTDALTGTLNFWDASADSATALASAVNLKSTNTSLVLKETFTFWTGRQRMDPGDTLSMPLTITTPDTAGDGGFFVVGYRVKEYSGE